MKNICLYFQIHHPIQFQVFRFLDIEKGKSYYNLEKNKDEICRLSNSIYLPTNKFLLSQINKLNGKLKVSFYISGTSLDLFMMFCPELLTSFRKLADTGNVEFIGGNTAHTIASFQSRKEFTKQISKQRNRIMHYFGQYPNILLDSDFFYSGNNFSDTGYKAIIINENVVNSEKQNPNFIFSEKYSNSVVFIRNNNLSRDFTDLFISKGDELIKNEDSFIKNLIHKSEYEPIVNIFIDYETFGEDKSYKIIFKSLTKKIYSTNGISFILPQDFLNNYTTVGEITLTHPVCYAERFNSNNFPVNKFQKEAMAKLFKLEKAINKSNDLNLKTDWLYLQSSDNFHLMDENSYALGKTNRISQFNSKYEAFINYMNILEDLKLRLKKLKKKRKVKIKSVQFSKT